MTAPKVWVCGRPVFHDLEMPDLEPRLIRVAGAPLAADGRRRRSVLCGECREGFFDQETALAHWRSEHAPAVPRRYAADPSCGAWMARERATSAVCGVAAGERLRARGPVVVCLDCGDRFPTRRSGRLHWAAAHVERPSRLAPIVHGTDRGYFAHRRRGEDPCDECRGAHADVGRRRSQGWWRGYGGGWLRKFTER